MCELIAAVTKPSGKWHKKQHQNKHKTQINTTTSNYKKKKKKHATST
jgi:Zn-finger nucleic acid-binding protein